MTNITPTNFHAHAASVAAAHSINLVPIGPRVGSFGKLADPQAHLSPLVVLPQSSSQHDMWLRKPMELLQSTKGVDGLTYVTRMFGEYANLAALELRRVDSSEVRKDTLGGWIGSAAKKFLMRRELKDRWHESCAYARDGDLHAAFANGFISAAIYSGLGGVQDLRKAVDELSVAHAKLGLMAKRKGLPAAVSRAILYELDVDLRERFAEHSGGRGLGGIRDSRRNAALHWNEALKENGGNPPGFEIMAFRSAWHSFAIDYHRGLAESFAASGLFYSGVGNAMYEPYYLRAAWAESRGQGADAPDWNSIRMFLTHIINYGSPPLLKDVAKLFDASERFANEQSEGESI